MRELQSDFEKINKAKLEALIGAEDVPAVAPAKRERGARRKAEAPAAKTSSKKSTTRVRTSSSEIEDLGEKILKALAHGAAIGRGAIASAVGIDASSPVLGNVLARLRKSGKLVMSGERRFAMYQLA